MDVDVPADRVLEQAQRIADHLLHVQRRVNSEIDALQARLLPEVRLRLGYGEVEGVDLSGLVNTRIAGPHVVVTPQAVATVLPLSAASVTTTRPGRRAAGCPGWPSGWRT